MKKRHLRRINCGLRIADCGFESVASFNPKSGIRNPKSPVGFTLIELMIVVVILGLLATMVMPKILSRPEQARRVKAKIDIRNIQSALAYFKTDTGRFPTTSEGLEALVSGSGIQGFNKEGYLERVPIDPWSHKYVYISPGIKSKDYDLKSYGKDGEEGGTGDDSDIESWNIEN